MYETAVKPTGVCLVCGHQFPLTRNGRMMTHPGAFPPGRCLGVGMLPKRNGEPPPPSVDALLANARCDVGRLIAAELVEQADDEALRPNRDGVSRAIEQTLRDAAETALRVAGLAEEEDDDG